TENPDKGTRYDRFRNRLMIPIRDVNGRIVGFGARTLEKDGIPKYLNSPQTALFDKSHLLYGLDGAKRHIREARQVVIVEGYMDVMQGWQSGFRNMVAQMGTALTEPQLRRLKRYTKRFVLALDADAAGQKATMRGLQVARETLDREIEVKFDARGLVQHEGRLQADIRIVTLPEGNDPDNIIRKDPTQWPKLLEQAQPVVGYVIKMATRDLDMNDAKGKTAVAQRVLPLIKDIVDPVERDHYWQALARALRIDERALRQVKALEKKQFRPSASKRPSTGRPSPTPPPAATGKSPPMGELPPLDEPPFFDDLPHPDGAMSSSGPPPPPPEFEDAELVSPTHSNARIGRRADGRITVNMREANYLSQCLHHPSIMNQVNQRLTQNQQSQVNESDFAAAEDRALLQQMVGWLAQGTVAPIDELCDSLDEILNERVKSLLALPAAPESELERLTETLVKSVLDWRLNQTMRLNGEVRQLVEEAKLANDTQTLQTYTQRSIDLWRQIRQINQARHAVSAVSQRKAKDSVR
ncbi:MAG: toprim domain-containing protein, partial [Chloroflexi bacterium]|nr:toprim domain-containing protein [Chloroflexota bacterium]